MHLPHSIRKRATRIFAAVGLFCGLMILWVCPIHRSVHRATSFIVAGGFLFVYTKSEMEQEKLRRIYRYAHIGLLTSNVMHDLSQPATSLLININKLENTLILPNDPNSREIKESLVAATKSVKVMKEYINSVRDRVQEHHLDYSYCPATTVQEVLIVYLHKIRKHRIHLRLCLQKELLLRGNPINFIHITSNLVNNSIESFANIEDGRIKDVVITLRQDCQKIILCIEDNGCGIPLKDQSRIFEPFFTTKITDGGCGFGLPFIKEIIETEMRGKITVESRVNIGTKFTVAIPL